MPPEIETLFEVSQFIRFHYLECSSTRIEAKLEHEGWGLVYVDKGVISVFFNGRHQTVESGHAIICRPQIGNYIEVKENVAANVYAISFSLAKGDLAELAGTVFAITAELRAYLKILLKEAKFAYRNDLRIPTPPCLTLNEDRPFGAEQMLKTLTEQLLICLFRELKMKRSQSYSEIVRENLIMNSLDSNPYFSGLIEYLERNIDKQLTIEQICKDNFTNRAKIQKVFKACTTEGVISFHQKLKIEYAKLMIREGNMNFTQISETLGFSSVHHFSKKFKQLVKLSPSSYAHFAK